MQSVNPHSLIRSYVFAVGNVYGPAHKIALLNAYAKMPLIIAFVDISYKARDLCFGLSLYLHSYFMQYMQAVKVLASLCICVQTCL